MYFTTKKKLEKTSCEKGCCLPAVFLRNKGCAETFQHVAGRTPHPAAASAHWVGAGRLAVSFAFAVDPNPSARVTDSSWCAGAFPGVLPKVPCPGSPPPPVSDSPPVDSLSRAPVQPWGEGAPTCVQWAPKFVKFV